MFSLRKRSLSRPRGAFTLLELIVVVVVLGVLAAIAIPTFSMVIEKSQDRTAEASLTSYAREVQAVAALDQAGLTAKAFEDAEADLEGFAAGPALLAASRTVDAILSPDDAPVVASRASESSRAVLSYVLGAGEWAGSAGVAAFSSSGNCVGVRLDSSSVRVVEMKGDDSTCTGQTALTAVAVGGSKVDSPAEGSDGSESGAVTPAVPTDVAVAVSGLTVSLSWPAVSGAASYDVSQDGGAPVNVSDPAATFTLPAGTSASFTVAARNAAGVSDPSTAVSVLVVPAVPTGVSVSPSFTQNTATLSWTGVPSATGYVVTQSSSAGSTDFEVSGTSWVSGPLSANVDYSFTVSSKNASGSSAPSAAVTTEASYAGTILSDGPVAYYRLLDSSTATAANAAAGVVPGAWSAGTYCVTGANAALTTKGTCVGGWLMGSSPITRDPAARSSYFGGGTPATGGGYVDLPATGTALTANGLTLEGWVYATDQGFWARVLDFSNGPENDGIWMSRQGTSTSVGMGGRSGVTGQAGFSAFDTPANGNTGLSLNTWHYLVATVTPSGAATVYVDGVKVSSGTGFDYRELTRAYGFIGRSSYPANDNYFKGYMTEIAVYQKVLSPEQVAAHYAAR